MSRLNIAFFVSGNGTLFETLATKIQAGEISATPSLLLSSDPEAPALQRAARLGVSSVVLQRSGFDSGAAFSEEMLRILNAHKVDFVCLAGYLKRVPSSVVNHFSGRMLNIHPALLPAFGGKGMYGAHVHQAVLEYGARITGVTVHLVDEQYDHGPIVLQRAVFVMQDDTIETLEKRVREVEYQLYTDAVKLFAQDRVQIVGRRVKILSGKPV